MCDFEHEGMCGWTVRSDEDGYVWQRQQGGQTLPDSGPSSDYTTGTSTGPQQTKSEHLKSLRTCSLLSISFFYRMVYGSDRCFIKLFQNCCAHVPQNKTLIPHLSHSSQILHLGCRSTHQSIMICINLMNDVHF